MNRVDYINSDREVEVEVEVEMDVVEVEEEVKVEVEAEYVELGLSSLVFTNSCLCLWPAALRTVQSRNCFLLIVTSDLTHQEKHSHVI